MGSQGGVGLGGGYNAGFGHGQGGKQFKTMLYLNFLSSYL